MYVFLGERRGKMRTKLASMAVSFIVGVVGASVAPMSFAQNTGSTATDATQAAPATKAQRKADRKAARAKKNAELKKLEDAGYNPARANDPNYPQDLQNAQKKAGVGGQSQ
jgi:predicted Rossmann fold nucleotide-binding protein DprA/Smf involved in DNA uptake